MPTTLFTYSLFLFSLSNSLFMPSFFFKCSVVVQILVERLENNFVGCLKVNASVKVNNSIDSNNVTVTTVMYRRDKTIVIVV